MCLNIISKRTSFDYSTNLVNGHQTCEISDIIDLHQCSQEVELLRWGVPFECKTTETIVDIARYMGLECMLHDILTVAGSMTKSYWHKILLQTLHCSLYPILSLWSEVAEIIIESFAVLQAIAQSVALSTTFDLTLHTIIIEVTVEVSHCTSHWIWTFPHVIEG